MNALIPMQFDGRAIRVVEDGGEPWFVGKDVAEALGYVNPTDAMNNHCRGVAKRYPIVDSLGRTQEARILSEPDVLRLIVNSKLPAAERFERWVFEEVLPSIRKTGGYQTRKSEKTGLPEFRMARAIAMQLKSADGICAKFPHLSEGARQVIYATLVNPVAGSEVIPLPRLERRSFTATEVGQQLGVSANMVGRLANVHGLKTEEDGYMALDKSASSDRTVETWRYYQSGIDKLATVLDQIDAKRDGGPEVKASES